MAKLNDFTAMTDDARALFITLLGKVPDSVWVNATDDLDMTVTINGVEVEDGKLDEWFKWIAECFNLEVRRMATEIVVEWGDTLASPYTSAIERAQGEANEMVRALFTAHDDGTLEDTHG